MAAKSTNTPATPKARSRRKTSSVPTATVIQLTPELISARSRKQELINSHDNTSNFTEAELKASRKHKSGLAIMALLKEAYASKSRLETRALTKEAYALMSEPKPKCKVIPLQVVNKRLAAKEA